MWGLRTYTRETSGNQMDEQINKTMENGFKWRFIKLINWGGGSQNC